VQSPGVGKDRIDRSFLVKRMETDEVLLIVVYAENGGAEDGFQPLVQFEILMVYESHIGIVQPEQLIGGTSVRGGHVHVNR